MSASKPKGETRPPWAKHVILLLFVSTVCVGWWWKGIIGAAGAFVVGYVCGMFYPTWYTSLSAFHLRVGFDNLIARGHYVRFLVKDRRTVIVRRAWDELNDRQAVRFELPVDQWAQIARAVEGDRTLGGRLAGLEHVSVKRRPWVYLMVNADAEEVSKFFEYLLLTEDADLKTEVLARPVPRRNKYWTEWLHEAVMRT